MQALASDVAALRAKLDEELVAVNRELLNTQLGIAPMGGLLRTPTGWSSGPDAFAPIRTHTGVAYQGINPMSFRLAELGRLDSQKANDPSRSDSIEVTAPSNDDERK